MSKKIQCYIKLQIEAGMANPSPPIGPALGQKGINIMNFCKEFNLKTSSFEKGLLTPVIITVYRDKSFNFIIKTPPTSLLIKKELGIKLGSKEPNKIKVGKINNNQLRKIAEIKSKDIINTNLEMIMRSVKGTASSMGIDLEKLSEKNK